MNRRFAQAYGHLETWHWWFRGRQSIIASVLRREFRGRAPTAIASLGCGPAEGLSWLQHLTTPNGRVVGVDSDLLHARRAGPRLQCIVGQIEALPLVAKTFDAVLALDVLEHLDDDTAGLREAARLVKPGGLLLVTVPALPSLWGGQDIVSSHRRRYTRSTFTEAFVRAGLPAPRATYFNTFLFPAVAAVRWGRRALGQANRLESDFDTAKPGLLNHLLALIFTAEQYLVSRFRLPIGISLLATLRLPLSGDDGKKMAGDRWPQKRIRLLGESHA
jgi:SAM-dependent methyltransferase